MLYLVSVTTEYLVWQLHMIWPESDFFWNLFLYAEIFYRIGELIASLALSVILWNLGSEGEEENEPNADVYERSSQEIVVEEIDENDANLQAKMWNSLIKSRRTTEDSKGQKLDYRVSGV